MKSLRLLLLAIFPVFTSVDLAVFGYLSERTEGVASYLYLIPFWLSQLVVFRFFDARYWQFTFLISGMTVTIFLYFLYSGLFRTGATLALFVLTSATLGIFEAARFLLLLYEIKVVKNMAKNTALILIITNALNLFFVYAVLVNSQFYFVCFSFALMVILFYLTCIFSIPCPMSFRTCLGHQKATMMAGLKPAIIVALAILCITLTNLAIGRAGSIAPHAAVFLDGAFLFGVIAAWVSANWPAPYMLAISLMVIMLLLVSLFNIFSLPIVGYIAIGWGTSRIIAVNMAQVAIAENVKTWRMYGSVIMVSQIIFYVFLESMGVHKITPERMMYFIIGTLVLTNVLWPSLKTCRRIQK